MTEGFSVKSSKIVETASTVQSKQPQGFSLNRQIVDWGTPIVPWCAFRLQKGYPYRFFDDLTSLLLLSRFKPSNIVRRLLTI